MAAYRRRIARDSSAAINEVPEPFHSRLRSLRAFDENDMLRDADVVEGVAVESTLLSSPETAYIHTHSSSADWSGQHQLSGRSGTSRS